MKNDLTIIIPTRNTVSNRTLESLPKNISLLVGVDRGEGQTKIRYDLAKKCFTKYILLLDDDVVLNEFDIKKMLQTIKENDCSAVCGELKPIAVNNFSKTILRYKNNPTSFYSTGITIWDREMFLFVMYYVPNDCPKNVGDLVIKDIMCREGIKFLKLIDVVANHYIDVSMKQFFVYRYNCGICLSWYHQKYLREGYLRLLLKMFFGLPLSRDQGIFVYRLGSFIGLLRGCLV